MGSPGLDFTFRVVEAHEPMLVQTRLPQPPVEALDRGVIRRFTRATEVDLNATLLRPLVHRFADELTAVVCLYRFRCTALPRDGFDDLDPIFAFQTLANMDR